MLVITRKVDQSVRIGDDVEVVIVGVEGNKVKLGILAPPHSIIQRSNAASKSANDSEGLLPEDAPKTV